MNFITKTLNKLFKSSNQQELNKIKPLVVKINDLEKDFSNYSYENFVQKTFEFMNYRILLESYAARIKLRKIELN